MRLFALIAALALALGGCASGWQVRGRIVRGATGPGEAPIEGVDHNLPLTSGRVTIECPEGGEAAARLRRAEMRTDMEGRFRGSGDGRIPMDCSIRVEADGYRGRSLRVSEVCTTDAPGDESSCAVVTVNESLPLAY